MKLEEKIKEMLEATKQMNCEEAQYIVENKNYILTVILINKEIKEQNNKKQV